MYMDDIELYSGTKSGIEQIIQITSSFYNDIQMNFGLEKYKTVHIYRCRLERHDMKTSKEEEIITVLDKGETCRYFGIQQARQIEHTVIKKEVTQKFDNRLKTLLKTRLNNGNLTKAINIFAMPVLTYTFGITKWTQDGSR